MAIDIESISYEELLELKHIIDERLKFLDSINTDQCKIEFKPGDKVYFAHPTLGKQVGTLLKVNQKTVSVITESGQKWDVSPHLLRKITTAEPAVRKSRKIISITTKK